MIPLLVRAHGMLDAHDERHPKARPQLWAMIRELIAAVEATPDDRASICAWLRACAFDTDSREWRQMYDEVADDIEAGADKRGTR